MGHGHQITPFEGNRAPQQAPDEKHTPGTSRAPHSASPASPKNPRENAPQLLDRQWQNSRAEGLRNNLAALIHGEKNSAGHGNITAQQAVNYSPGGQGNANNSSANRHSEHPKSLLDQTWESLIGRAREHQALSQFRTEPNEFWDDVRRMSEVRIVESYVNGKLEPRAVSRYGELLEKFNRQGGRLETFLATLPPTERNVFRARHQMNQSLGATELFAGKGIALDKSGQFPLRTFLSANAKSSTAAPHVVLSLLNGSFSAGNQASGLLPGSLSSPEIAFLERTLFGSAGAVMFSAKTAALLSLSLALYQNIDALLSLRDLTSDVFLPKQADNLLPAKQNQFLEKAAQLPGQNTFEKGKSIEQNFRRAADALAFGAVVSGALATIEGYHKKSSRIAATSTGKDSANAGFGFSAGATGAMMGATMGCIVPLAEKSAGEIIGFAASVVVGLTDSGLRSLGANTLVSFVTSGVQTFLNVSGGSGNRAIAPGSTNNFLNATEGISVFRNDLEHRLFSSRMTALLPS